MNLMGSLFLQISENKRVKYRLKSALKSDNSGHLNKNIKKGNKLERTHSMLKEGNNRANFSQK